MVFTSIPAAYLDAANWQQQQQQQQPNHQPGNTGSQQLLPPPAPQLPAAQPHGASTGGAGSIRPGSMVDRARMANLPMPEAALKCPRCESTNTKFCYFNNYSLSQPRHFCKTCRRYWTRNGALRNVPVGGGCRRNKRSKGSSGNSSRSSPASSDRQTTGSASSTNSVSSNSAPSADLAGFSPHLPPLRFMAPLHHHQLTDFTTAGGDHMALNYGLNYGGVGDLSFQIGNALGGGGSSSILEQWRVPQTTQQFPFLAGLEGSSQAAAAAAGGGGLYPFEGNSAEVTTTGYGGALRPKVSVSTSGMLTQLASVKMEDSRELSFLLGSSSNNNNNVQVSSGVDQHHQQFWMTPATSSAAAWTDHLSGFSSSSNTSNNQL